LPDEPRAAEARPGDAVPDVALVNHDGKSFRLSQLRGKTVVLTFIYTRCPLPNYCPLMNRNFASIAKALEPQPDRARNTHLLSVSFDPAYDTPAVLRKTREAFRPAGSQLLTPWDFATGSPADVRKLATFFGVTYEGFGANISHNLRTAVIGADGKVVRVFNGNAWQPSEVLAVLKE
jgi:protein SCO1/2